MVVVHNEGGVVETEHVDELILSTELGPTVGDDSESDDDTNEEYTEEGPGFDDFQCTWGDALGDSFDAAPYDSALLQSRNLADRKFIYYIDGVRWVVGTFLRKSYGMDSESFRVSFDGDITQTLQIDPTLYYTPDDFGEEVEVGSCAY
eukprot:CAMPEP_0114388248 /NCGR_PEP_ID=MMETSP0102-20121206/7816_1 /TAXON_ID=38822 ORGANISM="Pteridomonas danica, Strain PT" /NCGR_SAMPLE_ID=MMETSP0102 /ASSEMBLY_ACC=CAM_ASM_000212 /LENGTH=147 /DNA_ID=CAMNT_0001545653 /DNA_START=1204 /DNA_END=1647 /DNA_ORIENTATION=-